MSIEAFDYSFARPSISAMAAEGVKVVSRYLWDSTPGNKGISSAERLALLQAGIAVIYNYEGGRGNHLNGAQQGKLDGIAARTWADGIGVPKGTPIYYSCDLEVSPGQIGTVLEYLRAADHPDHRARPYAQFSVGEAFGGPFWQTLAWSGGNLSRHAVLYQYEIDQTFHGAAVDHDRILDALQLGAEWPAGREPKPPMKEFQMDKAASDRFDRLDAAVAALKADLDSALTDNTSTGDKKRHGFAAFFRHYVRGVPYAGQTK